MTTEHKDKHGSDMDLIRKYFTRDIFAIKCGIKIDEVSPGRAKVKMDVTSNHMNGMGVAHGGAIFTLADFAFAVACNSHGTLAVAASATIAFIKPAMAGKLYAEVWEEACGGRLGTYVGRVTDEAGELVATFQGLAYRKKNSLAEFV